MKQRSVPRKQQSGMALVVALVFLVLLTVIGIAALGNNTMQQRMTFGAVERNEAFQAADTAVLSGEAWLVAQTTQPFGTCTSAGTACTSPAIWARAAVTTPPVTLTVLKTASFWSTNGQGLYGQQSGYSYPNTALQPQYIIEDMGHDSSGSLAIGQSPPSYQTYYFQITGRGFGNLSTSQALVQSVYARSY